MAHSIKGLQKYSIGFVLSIILTTLAFLSVGASLSVNVKIFVLMSLAIAQLFVQLVFFLHLGEEREPRWNLMMLLLAIWFVFAVVAGSIWIMANLDYNMQPEEADSYLLDREGINKQ